MSQKRAYLIECWSHSPVSCVLLNQLRHPTIWGHPQFHHLLLWPTYLLPDNIFPFHRAKYRDLLLLHLCVFRFTSTFYGISIIELSNIFLPNFQCSSLTITFRRVSDSLFWIPWFSFILVSLSSCTLNHNVLLSEISLSRNIFGQNVSSWSCMWHFSILPLVYYNSAPLPPSLLIFFHFLPSYILFIISCVTQDFFGLLSSFLIKSLVYNTHFWYCST